VVGASAGALAAEGQRVQPLLDLATIRVGQLEGEQDRLCRDAADPA
jgi:hypothetical protein